MAKAELLMPHLLKWEGRYVNDKDDLGGATNKGVTLNTFRRFYGQSKTIDDLKKITDQQWLYIFKKGYWDLCKADFIQNQSMANMIVDFCYNSGTHSIKILQKELEITSDGIFGPNTLRTLNQCCNEDLFDRYKKARLLFLERICIKRPANNKFLRGWRNRVNSYYFYNNA